jgi:hypothetical protein
MALNCAVLSAYERGRRKELLVKIIRTLAACALAGSALVGTGVGVAAVATTSVVPTAVAASGQAMTPCQDGTVWEQGSCVGA